MRSPLSERDDPDGMVVRQLALARAAARRLASIDGSVKDRALVEMATALEAAAPQILEAGRVDREAEETSALAGAELDRLLLDRRRLAEMARMLREVAASPDPVGTYDEVRRLPSGLEVARVRVPLGVLAAVYDAQPRLTVEVLALGLKAGNALIMCGGPRGAQSNRTLLEVLGATGLEVGLPLGFVQMIEPGDDPALEAVLEARESVDAALVRGDPAFVDGIARRARIPLLPHVRGRCHLFVDREADLVEAEAIARDTLLAASSPEAPTSCLLFDAGPPASLVETLGAALAGLLIPVQADEAAGALLTRAGVAWSPTRPGQGAAGQGEQAVAVRIVDGLEAALDHIGSCGTGHSEAISTRHWGRARRFQREVDAACVFVNASPRLARGRDFGRGAEIGISTGRVHARGPVGAAELTSYKYLIAGDGSPR